MRTVSTFTSSLPVHLLADLNTYSKKLHKNKNELIEQALKIYFHELKRLEYVNSFKRASGDKDLFALAESGLGDYLKQIKE